MTFTQLCFSFEGRINRALYWKYGIVSGLIILLVGLVCLAILDAAETAESEIGVIVVMMIVIVTSAKVIFADLAVTVKRLHDTNRSGWHLLMVLIPIVGAIYLFVVCGCLKGTDGNNDYGPPVTKSWRRKYQTKTSDSMTMEEKLSALERLSKLKEQGILSDAELQAEKNKIMG